MEILILIARIIILILEGVTSNSATRMVADESGVSFAELWGKLPSRYK